MNRRARSKLLACVLASLAWGFHAQRASAADDPMSDDPEVERRLLQLPKEFDIQLYASEPEVVHPVTINFDSRGQLWALCIPGYPQMLAGQEPRDFITVLGKADKNGHAESAHIFADKLAIPTGMIPGDGGVYVGHGDTLLHMKDTDGDGKADQTRVLLTGFGTQDMHHAINTFRWGPDGCLYFDQGVYTMSSVETPRGLRRQFGGCVWQFRPDSLDLEIHDRSVLNNNTWGHAFDAYGRSIISSAWQYDINLVLPDTPLNTSNEPSFVPALPMTKLAGERHCGLEIISGRHFPDSWQGNLVSGGFESQKVYRFATDDSGDRLTARELPPLVISHHAKFRPVDMKIGPDGALYVSDWYNLIIQHNQVDFRDPRRDHERGRIWRITLKGRPLVPVPDLSDGTAAVLDHLKDPEQWTRDQVRRALVERDHKDVARELEKWVGAIHESDVASEHQLLEALWMDQTIGEVNISLLMRTLSAHDPRVRAAAATVLGYWHDRVPGSTAMIAQAAGDESLQVRLSAVLAAQRVPSAEALEAALVAVDRPADAMVDFELRKAALVLKAYWYPEFQSGKLTFNGDAKRLAFALVAIRAADAVPRLLELLKAGTIPREQQAELLMAVAAMGDAQQVGAVLAIAAAPTNRLEVADQARLLGGIADAMQTRSIVPNGDLTVIGPLIDRDDALGLAAIRLAGLSKMDSLRPRLTQMCEDESAASARRQAAMEALVQIDKTKSDTYLDTLARSDKARAIRIDAVIALSKADAAAAAKIAAMLLHDGPADDTAPLFDAFLHRTNGGAELASAMNTNKPTADAAKIGLREISAAGNLATPLMDVLRAAADSAAVARQSSPTEMKRLVELARTHGDPARGELVFRSAGTGCLRCHAIAGAGGHVGPDLAAIGTTAQPDFLVEHILQPNKHVKDGYTAYLIETAAGDSFTGVQLRESADAYVLRDATHDEMVIPKISIKTRRAIGTLMPTGLADNLTDTELADLVRFLSQLGKSGPPDRR